MTPQPKYEYDDSATTMADNNNTTTADWCYDGSCRFRLPGESDDGDSDMNKPGTFHELFERKGVNWKFTKHELHEHYAIAPGETLMEHGTTINRYAYLFQNHEAFLHFNMLNTSSLNMPFAMMGDDPLFNHLSLAMYSASLANNCAYCSTHGVALAATKNTSHLQKMLDPKFRSESDRILYKFGDSLGQFPADLSTTEIVDLKKYYTSEEVEWIVLGVALQGCNNFVAQACGVKLETGALDTAKGFMAMANIPQEDPSDPFPDEFKISEQEQEDVDEDDPVDENMFPIWRLFRKHPMAMVRSAVEEIRWKKGVPSAWPKVGLYLKETTGYNFPLIRRLASFRNMTQCYGGILRDSFDPELTTIGCTTKVLCQLVFGGHIFDEHLQEDACEHLRIIANRDGMDDATTHNLIEEMLAIAEEPCPTIADECEDMLDRIGSIKGVASRKMAATLILARALSAKPTRVSPIVIGEVATLLKPSQIMETVMWVGILISFHRILRFYDIKDNMPISIWENDEITPRLTHGSQTNNNSSKGGGGPVTCLKRGMGCFKRKNLNNNNHQVVVVEGKAPSEQPPEHTSNSTINAG